MRAREDAARTRQALDAAVERMSRKWPGLRAVESSEPGLWRVVIPEEHAVGHEAHFGQTVRTFFDWIDAGAEEPAYVDNMIVKYHTICEAWKQRSVAGGVLPAGSHPSKDHAE